MLHAYTETNPIVSKSHIIAPRHKLDSEMISIRCVGWLSSLDGDTRLLLNGGRPIDGAQSYTSSVAACCSVDFPLVGQLMVIAPPTVHGQLASKYKFHLSKDQRAV